jgi:hypothetical protein
MYTAKAENVSFSLNWMKKSTGHMRVVHSGIKNAYSKYGGETVVEKLIVVCRACNAAGMVENEWFEVCRDDSSLPASDCDRCPARDWCKQGMLVVCPICGGEGSMVFMSSAWMWKVEEVDPAPSVPQFDGVVARALEAERCE